MEYIGAAQRRSEDPRLLRGEGQYVGDLRFPGMLHAGFVRSPHAHARILSIDIEVARSRPGVVAVFTAADVPALSKEVPGSPFPPGLRTRSFSPLARDRVRYVAEAVVAVVAEDEHALADALNAVAVEYEPLDVVSDVEAAVAGGPLVWESIPNNTAIDYTTGFGDVDQVFAGSGVITIHHFYFTRCLTASLRPYCRHSGAGT